MLYDSECSCYMYDSEYMCYMIVSVAEHSLLSIPLPRGKARMILQ